MFEEAERIKKERGEDFVADLSLGNPIEEPPAEFLNSLIASTQAPAAGTHRYMNNAGYTETRAAVAAKLSKDSGLDVTGGGVEVQAHDSVAHHAGAGRVRDPDVALDQADDVAGVLAVELFLEFGPDDVIRRRDQPLQRACLRLFRAWSPHHPFHRS